MKNKIIYFFFLVGTMAACNFEASKLPILGSREVTDGGDSVYHQIPKFLFINQDGVVVSTKSFENKIYVADFFFTSCPTICPTMKSQLLRVYQKYKDNPNVGILSHTIDPRHDSLTVLKSYRDRLGIKGQMWQFVTGKQDDIYEIAKKGYLVTAQEDATAVDEGGFVHSGALLLIDSQRHIRGMYDGTKENEVTQMLDDMDVLLQENIK